MSDWLHGVKVPPLRTSDIRALATQIRGGLRIPPEERFPAMEFLEFAMPCAMPDFGWMVEETLPGGLEACAYPDGCTENPSGPFIVFSSNVYEAAFSGDGRARHTVLHECGHLLLHQKVAVHHRGPVGAQLRPYENSEWQASTFAGELLMPPESFLAYSSMVTFCQSMGVSRKAAVVHGKRLVRDQVIPDVAWLAA